VERDPSNEEEKDQNIGKMFRGSWGAEGGGTLHTHPIPTPTGGGHRGEADRLTMGFEVPKKGGISGVKGKNAELRNQGEREWGKKEKHRHHSTNWGGGKEKDP